MGASSPTLNGSLERAPTLSDIYSEETLLLRLDVEAHRCWTRVGEREAPRDGLVDATVAELYAALGHAGEHGLTR